VILHKSEIDLTLLFACRKDSTTTNQDECTITNKAA
jgi:hypothetical protein